MMWVDFIAGRTGVALPIDKRDADDY